MPSRHARRLIQRFPKEALNQSKCADWRAVFSPGEGEKSQMYFVYIKISRQNQSEKMPSRRARRLIQRFPNKGGYKQ